MLSPRLPAEEAVRAILTLQLAAIRRNEGGVLEDTDVEFLHDFRVAVRRSRSCLGQLKNVLPGDDVKPFRRELSWLGSVSGPTRDLDVFLLDLKKYRKRLSSREIESLDPLERLLRSERRKEFEGLAAALRGTRYRDFVESWGEYLRHPRRGGTLGDVPIAEVAELRARRGFEKMVEAGGAIDPLRDGDALHRLRIRGKKVRYLLELFRDALDGDGLDSTIATLKKLQRVLGEFNDLQVQRRTVLDYAKRMHSESGAGVETFLTLGRLIERLERRERRTRKSFVRTFEEFARAARARYGP